MCIPRDPLVLGQPRRPISSSSDFHLERDRAHVAPNDAGTRIEIDPQLVGMIEIAGAHRMRMQLDASKIDDPCKPGGVIDHDFFRSASRWKCERNRSQPRGALRRCSLLIERLAFGAVDVSLEDKGTVADSGERARCDRQVVANQIELRELGLLREV